MHVQSKYCQTLAAPRTGRWEVEAPFTSAKEENKQWQCQVQLRHRTPLIHCLLWAREPRPNSLEFAVCISILAWTHSAGMFFQHIAISQAICLLPQGLLSIECFLWSQQEITSNSVLLSAYVPSWKFISTTMFFQYTESESIMEWSLPGSCMSHFTMTYGVKRCEPPTKCKTNIHTQNHTHTRAARPKLTSQTD